MFNRRSLTSGLRLAVAVCAGLALLAGCGAGDSGQPEARSSHLLAETATVAAAPVAPGSIRMHFHRVQNDTAQWGVYSWDGPQSPSPAWISGRFMFTNTDAFFRSGGYITSATLFLGFGVGFSFFVVTRVPRWAARGMDPLVEGTPAAERRHQELLATLRASR